jgi:hypothetical protein
LPALAAAMGDGDLGVYVVRRGNIDQVDVVAFDELSPIRLDGLVAPFRCERLGLPCITRAEGLEHRAVFEIEEIIYLGESVRVGPAHEAVADESDAKRFHSVLNCGDSKPIHSCRRKRKAVGRRVLRRTWWKPGPAGS